MAAPSWVEFGAKASLRQMHAKLCAGLLAVEACMCLRWMCRDFTL